MSPFFFETLPLLEKANLFVTLALVGLIWTIQLVHYPAFHFIEADKFISFEKFHTERISLLVLPLMLAELFLAIALLYLSQFSLRYFVSLGFVIAIWLSTFLLSVPCHHQLAKGKSEQTIHRLVATNWPRTILWSLKGLLTVL